MRAPGRSRRLNLLSSSSTDPSAKSESPPLSAKLALPFISTDHFASDARDEEWLSRAGQEGWVVLTKDHRIRYRNLERAALMNAGVGAFILTAGDLQGAEMAQIFVKALPAISRFLAKHSRPFIAKITRNGAVAMLFG